MPRPNPARRATARLRHLALTGLVAAGVGAAAPAASAGIWTPVPSGTTETITALSYLPGSTLFGTANGKIFTLAGGLRANFPGLSVIDLAVSPSGGTAVAVLTGGKYTRSTDGGTTWGPATQLFTYNLTYDCGIDEPPVGGAPMTQDPTAVAWANDSIGYISSNERGTLFKTVNGGASFVDVSRTPTGKDCRFDTGSSDPVTDIAPVTSSDSVYFISQSFGATYLSSDALTSSPSPRASSVNCFDKVPSLAVDSASQTRLVAGDRCSGSLSLQYSDDSGQNFSRPDISPSGVSVNGEYDVSFTGGTAIWVGNAGDIFTSADGRTAYAQKADGVDTTRDWRTVSAYSASNAAIGGVGGALVVSAQANSIPDVVEPAGSIVAPGPVTAGVAKSFSAILSDNAGGSGVDPASITWTANGIPAATGNPVTLTFPGRGYVTLKVSFKDFAGNAGEATTSFFVEAAAPAPVANPLITPGGKSVQTFAGGAVTLQGPAACVPSGTSFNATMSMRRITIKNNKIVKLRKVVFYVDGKKVKTDTKAPFKQKLKVKASAAGSIHTLKAVGTIKVKRGKEPKKTQTVQFQTCS